MLLQAKETSWLSEEGLQNYRKMTPMKNYAKGIFYNIDLQELINNGFNIVYLHDYSHPTTRSELELIRDRFLAGSEIVVGGMEHGSKKIKLCAFDSVGEALQVSQETHLARKTSGGNYFYFVPDLSFGFANVEQIDLAPGDVLGEKYRLSWLLNSKGGCRLSTKKDLQNSQDYTKIILVRV